MLKFEYQIKLNDDDRPYIDIPEDYQNKTEDQFMVLEMSRYLILSLLTLRRTELPDNEVKALQASFDTLEVLSDELAILLRKQMEVLGETILETQRNYHIRVDTLDQRNELKYNGIVHDGKIFKRVMGLKVLVLENMEVYELVDGIDNEHWRRV